MFTPNPRFTKHLVESNFFRSHPLTVIDVGARDGVEPHWSCYGDSVRIIGFEPDFEECEKLNKSSGNNPTRVFYPFALHKDKSSHAFYHMSPVSSGLYPPDPKFINRFPVEDIFTITKTSTIDTIDFDSFADTHGISDVDFMKLDTEGSELDILRGSINQLKRTVLGISCEVLFFPWRDGGETFSEVEQFLRPLGFKLYDLDVWRFANKSFPSFNSVAPVGSNSPNASYGQIIQGQAVFFRDPVAEIENKKLILSDWDEARIIKMASLFEHFRMPDCAIELLDVAVKHRIITDSEKMPVQKFHDLITSGFLGRATTYERYIKKLAHIKKRGYLSNFDRIMPYLRRVPYLKNLRDFVRRIFYYFHNNHIF
ncbi:MAG: FkbM family methyltransferase [Candidatus Jorgensenbacteria bacterium]|nr:FkbM family methyltransferase [Candidatus Jorgensenbacteria bacterium]